MRQLLKSKKGAEMTIGTIIIIILALVVLIFLIYSFMKGGGSLMDNLKNFFGGGTNVDTIKNACQAACTTQSVYSFCGESRTLRTEKSTWLGSCQNLVGNNGIAPCQAITCESSSLPKTCKGVDATADWSTDACASGNDLTSQVGNSDGNDLKAKPYCCKPAVNTAAKTCEEQGAKWVLLDPPTVTGCDAGKSTYTAAQVSDATTHSGQICCQN